MIGGWIGRQGQTRWSLWVTPLVFTHSSHCRLSRKEKSNSISVSKRSPWPQDRVGIGWGQSRCGEVKLPQ